MNGFIRISVLNDEEDLIHFGIELSNGICSASLDFYEYVEDFKDFGRKLCHFPTTINDMVTFNIGDDAPKWAYYLNIKVFCYDGLGHSVLKIVVYNFGDITSGHKSEFSILAEPASINKLGNLLLNWNLKDSKEIYWESYAS